MSKKTTPKPFAFTRDDLLREIADITGGRCLLAFSRGKDALATWLTLRESGLFPEIVPYHMSLVPGLRWIEEDLDYYEDWFATRIIRLPHISFYRQIGSLVFQPPHRESIIRELGFDQLTNLTYRNVQEWICEDLGWDARTAWTASGVRAADSPQRRIHIVKGGAKSHKHRQFYPCFDMVKADVLEIIRRHGVRLPRDYEMFGRSFDGFDYRFVGPLKKHMPHEYETVKFWYPLVEAEILRHEGDGKDSE